MGRPMTEITLPYVHSFRDRHGRMRYYVRRKGHKKAALPGLPGSKTFMEAYHAAMGPEPAKVPRAGPRSLSALIASFYNSAAFRNLSDSSKKTYRHVLKHIEAKDGHRGVADLPTDKAAKIIEEIGADRPALANLTRSVMRKLFNHAVKSRWRATNPFSGLESYKVGTHHTWTDAELSAYEAAWPLGTRERLAFDLLFYTAQRVGDVAKMLRSDVVNGRIHVRQEKTGAELRIPIHPNLQKSLNAYGIKGKHLVGRLDGKPINAENLSRIVAAGARKAGLGEQCVCHGIRKARLRLLAESGASAKVIAALSGHKTLKEVERYTAAADVEHLTDMAVSMMKRG
jgi:integrase